jgi:hypothetical protein
MKTNTLMPVIFLVTLVTLAAIFLVVGIMFVFGL